MSVRSEAAKFRRHALVFCFSVVVAFAPVGCSAPAPREQIYELNQVQLDAAPEASGAGAAQPALDGILLVNPLASSGAYGARRIAWRDLSEPLRLRLLDGHLWSSPPPLMVQERLLRCLGERRAAASVVPPGVPTSVDFVLDGRIDVFEAQLSRDGHGAIAVETELFLTRRVNRTLLWQQRFSYSEPINELSAESAVAGFARVLQQLCDDLVVQVKATP